jgi:ABC-type multidrug transport system fused ATPase/permease subunit
MAHRRASRSAAMPSEIDLEDGLDPSRDVSPWRIFALAKPEWKWLALGLVLVALSLTPHLLLPVVFGRIVDSLENGGSADERRREMEGYVVFLLVVLAIGSLFAMARNFIFDTAGERVVARLRIQLFNAILSQEIGLFDKRKTGELLSRLSSDTTSLQDVATSQVSMFFRGTIQLLFNAALMGYTSWKLTIVVFGVVPVVMVAIAVYARIVRKIAVKCVARGGGAAATTPPPAPPYCHATTLELTHSSSFFSFSQLLL